MLEGHDWQSMSKFAVQLASPFAMKSVIGMLTDIAEREGSLRQHVPSVLLGRVFSLLLPRAPSNEDHSAGCRQRRSIRQRSDAGRYRHARAAETNRRVTSLTIRSGPCRPVRVCRHAMIQRQQRALHGARPCWQPSTGSARTLVDPPSPSSRSPY